MFLNPTEIQALTGLTSGPGGEAVKTLLSNSKCSNFAFAFNNYGKGFIQGYVNGYTLRINGGLDFNGKDLMGVGGMPKFPLLDNARVILNPAPSYLEINVNKSGLGGLDTGTMQFNKYYYTYVVANENGGIGAVCSLQPDIYNVTMPEGYTMICPVSTFFYFSIGGPDGSWSPYWDGGIVPFREMTLGGRRLHYFDFIGSEEDSWDAGGIGNEINLADVTETWHSFRMCLNDGVDDIHILPELGGRAVVNTWMSLRTTSAAGQISFRLASTALTFAHRIPAVVNNSPIYTYNFPMIGLQDSSQFYVGQYYPHSCLVGDRFRWAIKIYEYTNNRWAR